VTASRKMAATRAAAILTAAAAASVWAGSVLLAAPRQGVSFWGTSPGFVVPLLLGALVATAASPWVWDRDRVVGAWLAVLAAATGSYVVCVALATEWVALSGRSDLAASMVALLGLTGFVPPLLMVQACLVVARDRLAGEPVRWAWPAFWVALTLVTFVQAATSGALPPPFSAAPPLLPRVEWLAFGSPLGMVVYFAFLGSVLVGPVLLWRAVGRRRGQARRRLAILATVSLLPVTTTGSCVLLLPALERAGLQQGAAADLLFSFFGAAMALVCVGVAVATTLTQPSTAGAGRRLFDVALKAAVTIVVTLVVLTVGATLATLIAPNSVLVGILAAAVSVALAWPLRGWLVRVLGRRADPVAALAARKLARLGQQGRAEPGAAAVEVLQVALGDPDLRVVLPLPDQSGWVDAATGELTDDPSDAPAGQRWSPAGDDPNQVAALVLHRAPLDELIGPLRVVEPLLDRAVLETAVRHRADEAAAARKRAESAVSVERQRLERDLHDGVQGRLLAVALDLQASEAAVTDPIMQLTLERAVGALRDSIQELRELAVGDSPGRLARGGLPAALGDLVGRLPVPVQLKVTDDRFEPALERTAYLAVAEALTNSLKHAGDCAREVSIAREGGALTITVADDGVGGADLRAGTGLRGVQERVHAAGGTLVVSERMPHGTVVEVALPCGP